MSHGSFGADENPTYKQYLASLEPRRRELHDYLTSEKIGNQSARGLLADHCYRDGIAVDADVDIAGELPGPAYLKRLPATKGEGYIPVFEGVKAGESVGIINFDTNPAPWPEKYVSQRVIGPQNGDTFAPGPAIQGRDSEGNLTGHFTVNPQDLPQTLIWADEFGKKVDAPADGQPTDTVNRYQWKSDHWVLANPVA